MIPPVSSSLHRSFAALAVVALVCLASRDATGGGIGVDVQGTAPVFGIQPSDLRTFEGQAATFTVNISGSPSPTCQWQRSVDLGATWTNLTNTAPYSGVTTWFLNVATTNVAMSGTQFRCLGSNTAATVASTAATLSVGLMAAGAVPGGGAWSGTFTQGGTIGFNVTGGTQVVGLTMNTSVICGATLNYGPTIVGTPISGERFRVDISSSCPVIGNVAAVFSSATGADGILTYSTSGISCACSGTFQAPFSATSGPTTPSGPQIVVQPATAAPVAGQNARFTMAASGRPFATIQWQVSTNGGTTFVDVPAAPPYSGTTSPTLTVLDSGVPGLHGAQYKARAQNASGTVFTDTVSLVAPGMSLPPTTVGDTYSTPFNTTLSIAAPGVLANDASNGGGAMTATLQAGVTHGALTLNSDGSLSYTPTNGYSGPDQFTYRANNSGGAGNIATVTLTVGANTGPPPPTAIGDAYFTTEGVALSVPAPGVLANDNAAGGGAMSAILTTSPTHGSVTLATDGSFVYTPANGFVGNDSFAYRASTVNGGAGNIAIATIGVTSSATPVPPANFRVIGMAGNAITFAWALPVSGPTPLGVQLEGGLTPGSVLGSIPIGAVPSATLTLPSGSFYLRVRTLTANGPSVASNEILVHVSVPVAPSPPANLLGMASGSQLTLSWTSTFTGGQPTAAVLDVSGAVSASLPLSGVESFSFPGVPPGTYTFAVRQTGAGGSSLASTPVTLTFPGSGCAGAPQVPANFLAFKSTGSLYLSWDPPVSGPAVTGYLLNVSGSFVGSLPMAARQFSVPAPPGSFTLSIAPFNACGTGTATAGRTVNFP